MTSRNFRMDTLLAGTLIPPWRFIVPVWCPAPLSLWKSFRGIVKTIPAWGGKLFAFGSGIAFTFSPESCSP
jgi:hypothetical protein